MHRNLSQSFEESDASLTTLPTSALLVSAKEAAKLCGKSLRTWRSWDAAGLIPRPVRIRSSTLWRAEELRSWVSFRCPCREEWESLKKASKLP
jgi:predicted DNA-binding transcriptional regulator AlpA